MTKQMFPNTVIKFQMMDAEVEMTLQMFALYQLKNDAGRGWSWDKYNKITQGKGTDGELDIAYLLYTATLCRAKSIGEEPRYATFEEFLRQYPPDDDAVTAAYRAMRYPKKA